MVARSGQSDPRPVDVRARNEVVLVGRVSGAPQLRELPSGDILVTWRVVVDRPPAAAVDGVRTVTVDTVDCVARSARTRRSGMALLDGDMVHVEGALRRRFWRAGSGAASRCEVEVVALRRLRRRPAAQRAGRRRDPQLPAPDRA